MGRQNKISDNNQMHPQLWEPGIENRQEMPVLNEKLELISRIMFCEIDIN